MILAAELLANDRIKIKEVAAALGFHNPANFGKAFKRFTILITPDSQPRDRRYPALTRIGQGWQLYGPYFQAAAGQPADKVAECIRLCEAVETLDATDVRRLMALASTGA